MQPLHLPAFILGKAEHTDLIHISMFAFTRLVVASATDYQTLSWHSRLVPYSSQCLRCLAAKTSLVKRTRIRINRHAHNTA